MKKKKIGIVVVVAVLIIVSIFGSLYYLKKRKEQCATYNSFVLVQKNTANFEQEWFEIQFGLDTDFVEKKYLSTSRFIRILEKKIKLYPNATSVFIEVPADLSNYIEFEELLNAHPSILFYTYCTVQPLSWWEEMDDIERMEKENQYNITSEKLNAHENVVHFEFYNLEWLIGNPLNFKKDGSFNETASLAIFHSYTDHLNAYHGISDYFSEEKKSFENKYEDKLEGKTAILFGDSIWDIDRTSTGVESVIEELSGLEIENLAIGGSCAAFREGTLESFLQVVDKLLTREERPNPDYIFIEYGLNDYFAQVPVENAEDLSDKSSYKGALSIGIEILKNNFPESKIILVGPTTILAVDAGTLNISGEGSLRDYEKALEEIAKECNLSIIKNYQVDDLNNINAITFLRADQVHFNEKGMYIYGKRILDYLCDEIDTRVLKWYDSNFYIAHACGGINGYSYSNCLEAFEINYELGHRVFEIDFSLTSDEKLVATHDWSNKSLGEIYGITRVAEENEMPLSCEYFLKLKAYGMYTTLSFEDVLDLMEEYPDIYIVLDTKASDTENIRKQYQIISEKALEKGTAINRIIPQIYNEEMYETIREYYLWNSVIYTMYGLTEFDTNEVIEFCKNENIEVVATFPGRAEFAFINELKEQGVKIYMHTFNTSEEVQQMVEKGADGIYTDFLYPNLK